MRLNQVPDVVSRELARACALLQEAGYAVSVVRTRVGGLFPSGPERVLRQRRLPDGTIELLAAAQFALGESTRRKGRR